MRIKKEMVWYLMSDASYRTTDNPVYFLSDKYSKFRSNISIEYFAGKLLFGNVWYGKWKLAVADLAA